MRRGGSNQQQQQQKGGDGKHSILLIQQTPKLDTRTYTDHESVAKAMDHLVNLFEDHYKHKHNSKVYDSKELFAYLDHFQDISILTFDKNIRAYVPNDREWIKNKLYMFLTRES